MTFMTVQVVTPDGIRYDHHANFISVKTPDGEMGILPEHINLIAPLTVHEMKIRRTDDDNHVDWVAINGGIIEIKDNLVTIVADSGNVNATSMLAVLNALRFVLNVNWNKLKVLTITTKYVAQSCSFAVL